TESAASVTSVLFGDLLAVTSGQLVVFGGMTALIVVVLAAIGRPLLFVSVDPQVAEAKGVPVRVLALAFMVLLALVTTMAVQVVGTLLLFALVVTPAATALVVTARPWAAVGLSTAIALGCVWVGLTLSVMFDLPPSFPIVAIAFVLWLVVTLGSRRRGAAD
ncbi:MAG: metal ABC transporter permease, partial [Actinobacteria bacterium]|nr:metal ABC transporter permease [Actinomycetota bacterium]